MKLWEIISADECNKLKFRLNDLTKFTKQMYDVFILKLENAILDNNFKESLEILNFIYFDVYLKFHKNVTRNVRNQIEKIRGMVRDYGNKNEKYC